MAKGTKVIADKPVRRGTAAGMTFAEFGVRFIDLVITAETIGKQLAAALPNPIQIDEPDPVHVWGKGLVKVGPTRRAIDDDTERERVFETPLGISLTLYIDEKIGQENYVIEASLTLRLIVQAVEQLTIAVSVDKVEPANIKLTAQGRGNWLDIAKRLFGLEARVKDAVAKKINDAVSASDTSIDILAKVQQSLSGGAGGGAPPQSGGDKKVPPLKGVSILKRGGDPIASTINPGSFTRVALPTGDTEDFEITVLAQKVDKKDEDGTLVFRAVDAQGGELQGWGMAVFASGDGWDRKTEIVYSSYLEPAGQAFITLENETVDQGKTPAVRIKIQTK